MKIDSNNKRIRKGRLLTGFTLIELLITIVIFVLLTGVVLFNQKDFDGTILLKNLTYDIALTIRQAQIYGVNVKESKFSGDFSSYGIYFDSSLGENQKFIFFADTGYKNNDAYTNGTPDKKFSGEVSCLSDDPECIQKYLIKKNFFISKLCVGTDSNLCSSTQVDKLIIYFQRPNPDALIYYFNDGDVLSGDSYNYSEITISSNDGTATSTIVVTGVGQIYVKK
ncbi:MAG: prepilin-type N-terminal cleavage/methylation domain-containing protein [Candidatus Paceibacterota bacterium]|jgi:prepilin-type N-terminal cleavage/methylation domain-containing protein